MEKKKNTIKLTESQLYEFIENGVKMALKEYAENLHKEDDGQNDDDDSDNTNGWETEEESEEREKKERNEPGDGMY